MINLIGDADRGLLKIMEEEFSGPPMNVSIFACPVIILITGLIFFSGGFLVFFFFFAVLILSGLVESAGGV